VSAAKISTSYEKSMSLNSFPVTDLRPEVEFMHLLRMRRHYYIVIFEADSIGQTSSSPERYFVHLSQPVSIGSDCGG